MISVVCRSVNRTCLPLSSYRSRVKRLMDVLGLQECELSIMLVDDEEIQRLNREFRQKDAPTDVLSFPQLSSVCIQSLKEDPALLGDIVLSLPTVARQAQDGCLPRLEASLAGRVKTWSVLDEATFLTIHGLLHLLGYDHEDADEADEMETMEGLILRILLFRGVSRSSLQSFFEG